MKSISFVAIWLSALCKSIHRYRLTRQKQYYQRHYAEKILVQQNNQFTRGGILHMHLGVINRPDKPCMRSQAQSSSHGGLAMLKVHGRGPEGNLNDLSRHIFSHIGNKAPAYSICTPQNTMPGTGQPVPLLLGAPARCNTNPELLFFFPCSRPWLRAHIYGYSERRKGYHVRGADTRCQTGRPTRAGAFVHE